MTGVQIKEAKIVKDPKIIRQFVEQLNNPENPEQTGDLADFQFCAKPVVLSYRISLKEALGVYAQETLPGRTFELKGNRHWEKDRLAILALYPSGKIQSLIPAPFEVTQKRAKGVLSLAQFLDPNSKTVFPVGTHRLMLLAGMRV